MARTITIRIMNADGTSSPSPDPNAEDTGNGKEKASPNPDKRNKKAKNFAKTVTKTAMSQVIAIAEAGYSRYLSMSEDYKAQTAMENAKAVIGVAKSTFATTKSMTKAGAIAGGPVAAVVGFAVGLVTSTIKTAIQARKTLAEQDRQLQEEAYALYFANARAGMVNYSRGTEN